MSVNTAIGKDVQRKDAWDKVTGRAVYTDDLPTVGVLAARLLTSTHAHARILSIDISAALRAPGVLSVLTGHDCPLLFGPLLKDRPALATDVVRYAGEPVALVVALDEPAAQLATELIRVQYEPLAAVLTPAEALAADAPLLHPGVMGYKKMLSDIYPEAGSNTASRYRVKKGDIAGAFNTCSCTVEQRFTLPPSAHMAVEVRTARAEISADGNVLITTASQGPYSVQKQLAEAFSIPAGSIQVNVPFVGGGFGGKAPVMLEMLAYLASRSVGGRAVRLTITREQDMATAPCRMGLMADIKLGADSSGKLVAADLRYLLDSGAYTDISPYMAKAIAMDCTGPYNIVNLCCDVQCVYTNHTYATSFRGFSHEALTFCIERALDMLAQKLGIDPLELRIKNAIMPGDLTPSQVECTASLIGDLPACLDGARELAEWGAPVAIDDTTVRAKGVACFWKTENPPTDAISGALLTLNSDGSINLNTGVVEIGSNSQTHLAQMLAEKLKMDIAQVHVVLPVDTRTAPEHWKTVASLTGYMAGNAVMRAADDLIAQLRVNGSLALGCPADEIEVAYGRVFKRDTPGDFIEFKDIVQGYKSPEGLSLGEPVMGRGGFMLKGLSMLDLVTGKGKTGPAWTLGAQVVEVEADLSTYTYRLVSASTVIDVGKVIDREAMRAMVAGGMAMGISLASREGYFYDGHGIPTAPNLRSYKPLHIGQEPVYRVGFVETPQGDSPYGVRSYSEHGIIGMPAALGSALSAAFGVQLTELPLMPEAIWRKMEGQQ